MTSIGKQLFPSGLLVTGSSAPLCESFSTSVSKAFHFEGLEAMKLDPVTKTGGASLPPGRQLTPSQASVFEVAQAIARLQVMHEVNGIVQLLDQSAGQHEGLKQLHAVGMKLIISGLMEKGFKQDDIGLLFYAAPKAYRDNAREKLVEVYTKLLEQSQPESKRSGGGAR